MQLFLSSPTVSLKCQVYIYTGLLGISMQVSKEGLLEIETQFCSAHSLHSFFQIISCSHILGMEVTIFILDFSLSLLPAGSLSLYHWLVCLMKFYSSFRFHLVVLRSLWSPSWCHQIKSAMLLPRAHSHLWLKHTLYETWWQCLSSIPFSPYLAFIILEGRDHFLLICVF